MNHKKNPAAPSRRRFLQNTLAIIPATFISKPLLAHQNDNEKIERSSDISEYVPQFFNIDEWNFILAATDRLIPTDINGPGAISEGVPIFIDRQMELPYGYGALWYMQPPFEQTIPELGYQLNLVPRDIYRRGILSINKFCLKNLNYYFHQLEHDKQEEILHCLEVGSLSMAEDIPQKLFFAQLLENTKEGYFSDPIHGGNRTQASWQLIGFPGARADYVQVIEHPNTPYPLGSVSLSGKMGNKL